MKKMDLFENAETLESNQLNTVVGGLKSFIDGDSNHHDNGDSNHHDNGDSNHHDNGDSNHSDNG